MDILCKLLYPHSRLLSGCGFVMTANVRVTSFTESCVFCVYGLLVAVIRNFVNIAKHSHTFSKQHCRLHNSGHRLKTTVPGLYVKPTQCREQISAIVRMTALRKTIRNWDICQATCSILNLTAWYLSFRIRLWTLIYTRTLWATMFLSEGGAQFGYMKLRLYRASFALRDTTNI